MPEPTDREASGAEPLSAEELAIVLNDAQLDSPVGCMGSHCCSRIRATVKKFRLDIDRLRQESEQAKGRIEDLELFAKDLESENEALRQRADSLKAMLQRFRDVMLVGPFTAKQPTMQEVAELLEAHQERCICPDCSRRWRGKP